MKCHAILSGGSPIIRCSDTGLWHLNSCGGTGKKNSSSMLKGISPIFRVAMEDGDMRLLAILFAILAAVLGVSCHERSITQPGAVQNHSQSEKLSRIQNETGLVFPTNAVLVQFSQPDVAVDPVWVAKVVIPSATYEPFAHILARKPADSTIYDGALADSTSWWLPTNAVMTKNFCPIAKHSLMLLYQKMPSVYYINECAMF